MANSFSKQPVRLFGVPMDLGQKRRGVDMGPSAIRYAGLKDRLERLGLTVHDSGNVPVPIAEQIQQNPADVRAYNATAIGAVCQAVHDIAYEALQNGDRLISLGGDHSVSIGTVAAALECEPNAGVLWVDAHGDFNTPQTTPSGNVHGMVVAALMGRCPPNLTIGHQRLRPDQIVMIAIRDLDTEERQELIASGIRVFTMRDIDEQGVAAVAQQTMAYLAACPALHVSLDMDSLDPQVVRGVGTPVPGGLTFREAHLLMEMLADNGRVRSMDIVEVNPILDTRNETARVAVDLASSLFGQRIL